MKWESTLLYQHLYDEGGLNRRFIPLLFDEADEQHIPTPIKGSTYCLPLTEEVYLKLYRRLTGQSEISKPSLGKLKQLPLATGLDNYAEFLKDTGVFAPPR